MSSLIEVTNTLIRAGSRLSFVLLSAAACLLLLLELGKIVAVLIIPIMARLVVLHYREFRQKCWGLPWFGMVWCTVGYGSFVARYGYQAFPGTILIASMVAFAIWKLTRKFSALALLMIGAAALNGYAFSHFGMGRHFTCAYQDGVRPVLGECTVSPVERAEGAIIGASAFEMLFAGLPGAPPLGEFEYSPRDAVLCSNGKAVCAVFGQADRLDLKSAALKIDLATGDVVGTLWMYTAFSISCSDRHDVCTIVSEQGNRIYLVNEETWEVIREYDLRGLLPSYQVVLSQDEVAFLLVQGSGVDKNRVPTYGPVIALTDEHPEESYVGVLNLASLDFKVKPIRGKLPDPFMGNERLFASYDATHNLILMGSALAAVDLSDMSVVSPKAGVVKWYLGDVLTGGAVVDPSSGMVFVNRPFSGMVKYDLSGGKFQEMGRIALTMGGRPLERDSRRRCLVYSGNYGRGYVEAVDVCKQVVRARWTVGQNIRNVRYFGGKSPEDDSLVVTSFAGVYVIRIAEALGETTQIASK